MWCDGTSIKNNYQEQQDWTGLRVLSLNNGWIALFCHPLLEHFGEVYSLTWFHLLCWSWSDEMNPPQVIRTLLPLLLESSTESVAEISSNSLERILGPAESDEFLARVYEKLITGCYNILANHADPNRWAWLRRSVRFLWPATLGEMYQYRLLYAINYYLFITLLNRKFYPFVHFVLSAWTWKLFGILFCDSFLRVNMKKMEGLNVQIWKPEIVQQMLIKCCTRCDEVYKETDNISTIFVTRLLRWVVSGIR